MKILLRSCIFLLLLNVGFLQAQTGDTVRLCLWNMHSYGNQESTERNDGMIKVLNEINSDIFIIQNIIKDSSISLYPSIVQKLDKSFTEIPRIPRQIQDGTKESRMFYDPLKIRWVESIAINGGEHDDFMARFIPAKSNSSDTFTLYVAAFDSRAEMQRKAQAQHARFIVLGNYYHIKKVAIIGALYMESPFDDTHGFLIQGPIEESFIDTYGKKWMPDSSEFVSLYTNSTRAIIDVGCGGLSDSNRLRYRHDYILNRYPLMENYIPNSYTVFGNDGLDRRNSSITDPPNQIVSQEIAEALQCASSHLPVYADYVFGKVTSVENLPVSDFSLTFYPNPLQDQSTISCSLPADCLLKITLHDMLGREVAILHDAFKSAGNYTFPFKNEDLPNGLYFLRLSAGGKSLTKSVSIMR